MVKMFMVYFSSLIKGLHNNSLVIEPFHSHIFNFHLSPEGASLLNASHISAPTHRHIFRLCPTRYSSQLGRLM